MVVRGTVSKDKGLASQSSEPGPCLEQKRASQHLRLSVVGSQKLQKVSIPQTEGAESVQKHMSQKTFFKANAVEKYIETLSANNVVLPSLFKIPSQSAITPIPSNFCYTVFFSYMFLISILFLSFFSQETCS